MTAEELRAWCDAQSQFLGDDWLQAQEERKRLEAEFHDTDRGSATVVHEERTANRRFYAAAIPVSERIRSWIGEGASGRVFLDYACGDGWQAISAAQAGASLAIGIDISEISVRNATKHALVQDAHATTRFLQRDCETTTLPSASVDRVLCSGMLHHLDLPRAYPELERILAPGGEILCVEALRYNPAINLYRRLTPSLRTAWEREHILGLRDLELARRWFDVRDVRFHLMVSPIGGLLPDGPLRRAAVRIGWVVDEVLTRVPVLRLWSWMFSFRLVKRG